MHYMHPGAGGLSPFSVFLWGKGGWQEQTEKHWGVSYYRFVVADLADFGSGSVWAERAVVLVEGVLILAVAAGPAVPESSQL